MYIFINTCIHIYIYIYTRGLVLVCVRCRSYRSIKKTQVFGCMDPRRLFALYYGIKVQNITVENHMDEIKKH